jgi:hypothetical protein
MTECVFRHMPCGKLATGSLSAVVAALQQTAGEQIAACA